ncbi:MAG: sulfatase-like hydrolase/transferase [Aggregatilineales bacterium]
MTKPNFLFILTDEQKATAMPLYGNSEAHTPNLANMAAEGVLVDEALVTCPICVPSRGTLLTGHYPDGHGLWFNDRRLDPTIPDLFTTLRKNGYRVGLFGKNHIYIDEMLDNVFHERVEASHGGYKHPKTDLQLAFNNWVSRSDLAMGPWSAEVSPFAPEDCPTHTLTTAALDFIACAKNDNVPFAVWLSYPDPHTPLQAPKSYADRYPSEDLNLPPLPESYDVDKPARQQVARHMFAGDRVDTAQMRRALAIYYAMGTFIDDEVGRVIDMLDSQGISENTLVAYTSDHGDYMGEHRLIRKSVAFYEALIRVPLLFRWPGKIPAGVRSQRLFSLVDFAPTVLDLLDLPSLNGAVGVSRTAEIVDDITNADDVVFAEAGLAGEPLDMATVWRSGPKTPTDGTYAPPWGGRPAGWLGQGWMARTNRYKLVRYANGEGELYDLEADPHEHYNCFNDPAFGNIQENLSTRLAEWRAR